MKKSDAKKTIELVIKALKPHVEDDISRRLLESVVEGYFTPRQRKSDKVAFKEKVIKTLLQPYRGKAPLISEKRGMDFDKLPYTYYVKGDKMYLNNRKVHFAFAGQEEIADGYYTRKGELLKALSECPYDIWGEGLLDNIRQLGEEADFYLDSSQVEDLANQGVGGGEDHFFTITKEGVEKNVGLQTNAFKLIQKLLTEPEVKVSVRLNSSPLLVIKSGDIECIAALINPDINKPI